MTTFSVSSEPAHRSRISCHGQRGRLRDGPGGEVLRAGQSPMSVDASRLGCAPDCSAQEVAIAAYFRFESNRNRLAGGEACYRA